jgi:hypothetical protein
MAAQSKIPRITTERLGKKWRYRIKSKINCHDYVGFSYYFSTSLSESGPCLENNADCGFNSCFDIYLVETFEHEVIANPIGLKITLTGFFSLSDSRNSRKQSISVSLAL